MRTARRLTIASATSWLVAVATTSLSVEVATAAIQSTPVTGRELRNDIAGRSRVGACGTAQQQRNRQRGGLTNEKERARQGQNALKQSIFATVRKTAQSTILVLPPTSGFI